MLLDAGEGSLGQMWRLFGSEGGDEKGEGVTGVLKGLQVIWISHPHAVSDDDNTPPYEQQLIVFPLTFYILSRITT